MDAMQGNATNAMQWIWGNAMNAMDENDSSIRQI